MGLHTHNWSYNRKGVGIKNGYPDFSGIEPDLSKLEVSTTADDGAEDLEFAKGEGRPRERAENGGPRKGTIAGPMELIDNAGSWDNLMSSAMTCYMIWSRVFSLAAALLTLISSCICSLGSSSLRLWIGRKGNSLTSIGRPLFCPFYQHFCQGAVLISSLSMSGCATYFPKNPNYIDCVNHVNHRHNFFWQYIITSNTCDHNFKKNCKCDCHDLFFFKYFPYLPRSLDGFELNKRRGEEEDHPPTTQPKGGFWLLPALLLV